MKFPYFLTLQPFSGIVSVCKHRKGQLYTTAFIFLDNLWFLLPNFVTKMVSHGNYDKYDEWIRVENQWQKTVLFGLNSDPAITLSPRLHLYLCLYLCLFLCLFCICVVGHGQWSRNYLGTSSGQENIPSCTSLTTNEWTKQIISQTSFGRNGQRARYLCECIRAPNSGETMNAFSFLSDPGASLST